MQNLCPVFVHIAHIADQAELLSSFGIHCSHQGVHPRWTWRKLFQAPSSKADEVFKVAME